MEVCFELIQPASVPHAEMADVAACMKKAEEAEEKIAR